MRSARLRSTRLVVTAVAAGSAATGALATVASAAAPVATRHVAFSSAGTDSTRASTSRPQRRSALGTVVDYRYGVIAVRAYASGTKLVKLTIPTLEVDAQLSAQLARYSIPILEQEAIRAQSARVAAVSGATFTSEGFAMSLQSALTKLHIR